MVRYGISQRSPRRPVTTGTPHGCRAVVTATPERSVARLIRLGPAGATRLARHGAVVFSGGPTRARIAVTRVTIHRNRGIGQTGRCRVLRYEVNVWTARTCDRRFRALERGQALLFKLRSPGNAIVGGGGSNITRIFRSASPGRRSARRTARSACGDPATHGSTSMRSVPARGRISLSGASSACAKRLPRSAGQPAGSILRCGYGDPVRVTPWVKQRILQTVVADVYGRQCAVTREGLRPQIQPSLP